MYTVLHVIVDNMLEASDTFGDVELITGPQLFRYLASVMFYT